MQQRPRLLGLALTAAMMLGACSSAADEQANELPTLETNDAANAESEPTDGTGNDPEGAEPSEADQERANAEYEACLADLGIEFGSGNTDDGGSSVQQLEIDEDDGGEPFDIEAFEQQTAECDAILEDVFGDFELSPEQEAENADAMLNIERCMAQEGFEIDTSGGAFELDPSTDFEAFEDAMNSCSQEFAVEIDQ